uniref:SLX9 ribosome biogenesis factor n=1 Tax=Anser brachyrhynchus TaxID=132585 RepID=A0A8B9CB44_9AVES
PPPSGPRRARPWWGKPGASGCTAPRPAWHTRRAPAPAPAPAPAAGDWDFSSSDIFSGLNIDPDTLVKKLDLDSRSIISSRTGEKQHPKKEAVQVRLCGLTEIESVKLAKQKQKAEAKRKATPVVGDMQPLMEALPELSDLTAGVRDRKPPKRYVVCRVGCVFLFFLQDEVAFSSASPALPARPLLGLSSCLYYKSLLLLGIRHHMLSAPVQNGITPLVSLDFAQE